MKALLLLLLSTSLCVGQELDSIRLFDRDGGVVEFLYLGCPNYVYAEDIKGLEIYTNKEKEPSRVLEVRDSCFVITPNSSNTDLFIFDKTTQRIIAQKNIRTRTTRMPNIYLFNQGGNSLKIRGENYIDFGEDVFFKIIPDKSHIKLTYDYIKYQPREVRFVWQLHREDTVRFTREDKYLFRIHLSELSNKVDGVKTLLLIRGMDGFDPDGKRIGNIEPVYIELGFN